MEDSIFIIFLAFGFLWILIGSVGWIAFLKSEGEEIKIGKWGLLVALSIIIPIIITLSYGALHTR